ncbi:ABC transporter ATP-binding protein [Segnochrobactrum spirostomi]|uniref:ABC transporter ATP-binding protein n=1 Tax=Segnochrobactrum spirostomi TaxID=2608987 RepID=A0A6A7Y0M1_9HYPH|nr:ABC transporter ATP-binding protein [Segnochrobactrum spirostomi]MQT11372.1 ABC transporter ATP-binding protein [Segnochrobactrum spirostomi]
MSAAPLSLRIDDLAVRFAGARGPVEAVRGISFSLAAGSVTALVGESGSGKSASLAALLGLAPTDAEIGGTLTIGERTIALADRASLAGLRGTVFGAVFQDPGASLDPMMRIGDQVAELYRTGRRLGRADAAREAVAALGRVGLPDPALRARAYPHMLSGGQKQRVAIAMALAGNPAILLADEPTTALDPTVQAQVVALLGSLVAAGMGLLIVSHDLALAIEIADRIIVLYAGRIVEEGPAEAIARRPLHPYSQALAAASLAFEDGADTADAADRPFPELPGQAPAPGEIIQGCAFAPRCAAAFEPCRERTPLPIAHDSRRVACHLYPGEA